MARSAYETATAKSVTAWALVYEGKHAGNVLVVWSQSGATVTATVNLWAGPLAHPDTREHPRQSYTGRAGGYGYDKAGAAVSDAAHKSPGKLREAVGYVDAAGIDECRRRFESAGYLVCQVVG